MRKELILRERFWQVKHPQFNRSLRGESVLKPDVTGICGLVFNRISIRFLMALVQ